MIPSVKTLGLVPKHSTFTRSWMALLLFERRDPLKALAKRSIVFLNVHMIPLKIVEVVWLFTSPPMAKTHAPPKFRAETWEFRWASLRDWVYIKRHLAVGKFLIPLKTVLMQTNWFNNKPVWQQTNVDWERALRMCRDSLTLIHWTKDTLLLGQPYLGYDCITTNPRLFNEEMKALLYADGLDANVSKRSININPLTLVLAST